MTGKTGQKHRTLFYVLCPVKNNHISLVGDTERFILIPPRSTTPRPLGGPKYKTETRVFVKILTGFKDK